MSRQPSTDLYFRNAMARWIGKPWYLGGPHGAPIRRVGANSFIAGDWFILIRRDTPHRMRDALAWGGRLAYVIDDDVAGGIDCPALPPAYRARLAAFERDFQRDLLARADAVLAASDALVQALAALPGLGPRLAPRLRRIDPVWRQPLADTAHFAALQHGAPLRIVHLGTGSHYGAQATIAPLVADTLDRHPHTTFTYFAPRRVDDRLEHHPRARRLEPMTWREYQRWMARQRFHLALYPLAQTAFDRARSASKITEHAILGAVGLYPQSYAPAHALEESALLAPDDPAQWADSIDTAIAARASLRPLAENAAQTLTCINLCAVQQSLWTNLLSLDVR